MSVGSLILSLDFELHWGRLDRGPIELQKENLLGARDAIPTLLDTFARYQVSATWATVGFLLFKNKKDLIAAFPKRRPTYANKKLDPYLIFDQVGEDEAADPLHFAGSLVKKIIETEGQELGSHSFSHFNCLAKGVSPEDFYEDLVAARDSAKKIWDVELKSLVFPRNQFSSSHIEMAKKAGFLTFRGNPTSHVYRPRPRSEESRWIRATRLLDAYIPLTRPFQSPDGSIGLENVSATRFVRPYSRKLSLFESFRIDRIKGEMTKAARYGWPYHLWWHPHNFGSHTQKNLFALKSILDHFKVLKKTFDMESHSMISYAEKVTREN